MARPTRLADAHHRLRTTRYAIGVAAAGAFVLGAVVVRAAHPAGSGSAQATQPSSSATTDSSLSGSSGDDSGSYLSPATSPPVIQSSGS